MELIENRLILSFCDDGGSISIENYIKKGGYKAVKKALEMKPEEIIEEVKKSGLRGRGGAGFPTGQKWSFVPNDNNEHYLVINADEGEPGTFKDREILEKAPHLLIEGSIISAYAIRANEGFIYLRAEYLDAFKILKSAIKEAYENKLLGKNILGSSFSFDLHIYPAAGAYICGEETALLNSLEGGRGIPRLKPPFPAIKGLYGKPTVVNNVETIANIPIIINNGGDWYRKLGTEKSPGTKIFTISGAVNQPKVCEFELGKITFRQLMEYAGGLREGSKLVGIVPGGLSAPILVGDEIDIPTTYEDCSMKNTMLGSGAVIVIDDRIPLVKIIRRSIQFFAFESCGWCTPCRDGLPWATRILRKIEMGKGEKKDLDILYEICNYMKGKTFCALGEGAQWILRVYIEKFGEKILEV
ncbi:MAG: NADH-quinone oxidoreductase subunit NuoF [candidate division WOR-3 bacterium]